MMVSSLCKYLGVEGKVCNWFLPSRENDPHHLCVACRGKSCRSDDCCEECHDWIDDCCNRVSDYIDKLSLQQEKKRERKAKASSSSSSFSGFSPSMPLPLGQLPSSVGSGVVTTTLSSSVCAVTFSTAASIVSATPFVSPVGITPVEPSHKQRRVESLREREKMLAAFEELWASKRSSSARLGLSSAPHPPLVTPPAAVPAPVSSAVLVVVSAAVSARSSSSSRSASSMSRLRERSWSHHSPGPRPVRALIRYQVCILQKEDV